VEDAKSSGCGKPPRKPRVPFTAKEIAVNEMVALAKPLLSTGGLRSAVSTFTTACKDFLEAGEDELANYCGQVCSEMAAAVQGLSDQHANKKQSTVKLEKQLSEARQKLSDAQGRRNKCHQSKTNIEGFRDYLMELDKDVNDKHAAVRRAEYDLDSALWALEKLTKRLQEQQDLISDAADLLTGKQAVVQEAREALEAVKKDEDQFIEQIGSAKSLLNELREQLSNMKKANEVILRIKEYVSATAFKMRFFVDAAVWAPVRDIGLIEETNVWDYFSKTVGSEQCSTSFKEQLTDFHDYCTGPAMAAFEQIKDYVDLTPLCRLDPKEQIAAEEDHAVQDRIGLLTEDLQGVQTWLDPFRGTKMTTTKETELVEAGEPDGLRQIVGVYGKIKLYTDYMKEWKIGRGKFHDLLKQLTDEMGLIEAEIQNEDDVLENLKVALTQANTDREAALEKLNAALADEEAALQGKAQFEKAGGCLKVDITETHKNLKDLEYILQQAIQMYRDARGKLVSEYTSGKGALSLGQVRAKALSD
jgi:chromosome segregation ATPase